jgi:hypothetical protein
MIKAHFTLAIFYEKYVSDLKRNRPAASIAPDDPNGSGHRMNELPG